MFLIGNSLHCKTNCFITNNLMGRYFIWELIDANINIVLVNQNDERLYTGSWCITKSNRRHSNARKLHNNMPLHFKLLGQSKQTTTLQFHIVIPNSICAKNRGRVVRYWNICSMSRNSVALGFWVPPPVFARKTN